VREAAKNIKGKTAPRIEPEAMTALTRYTWPGNVRQLQHVLQRLVASGTNGHIGVSEVREALNDVNLFESGPQVPLVFGKDDSLDVFLDRIVLGLYTHFRNLTGDHAKTARMLRTDRNNLYKRVRRARERTNANGSAADLDEFDLDS
jgi:DNA-binding NtrC family response regulator